MTTPSTRATGTVLDRIVADRRERLAEDRRAVSEEALLDLATTLPGQSVDFASRLRQGRHASPATAALRLIGEVKRASPSKGVFDADLDAARQARRYAAAGASAVSVLTEPTFFAGHIADLRAAREEFGDDLDRPALLRKDFLFDPYQVREARANGADALLLIVMMLEPAALADLIALTHEEGLEALVEVHDESEVEAALAAGACVIGVNNRDLRDFREDLGTFERLARCVPAGTTLVAESSIHTAEDARRMAAAGAHAILVGEALVRSGDVEAKAHELMLVGERVAS
ncbi:MAG: indole-3-glycerol phosphate synthase TrpC [Dehalococcoidia bacterium]|nr:indole-3-glycerol phosphate synthase TrpC [Dehalococcoidia bacterium]